MIQVGEVINGKYKLVRLLGDGGMGTVYEGQHEVLGTRVAIKVLHPELARRSGLVERFLQEAKVAAQIKSANVVHVTDVDRTSDGNAFIVMELLEGEPLSTILDRQRRLPVATACEYTRQILEALEAAHALGVIHRDLKPENVFVTFAGGKPVLKLIDFGIAKLRHADPATKNLTVAGVLMGTAEYMAPEQARSAKEVDARSDVYSVGVMLYEMLAGTRPVLGDDARIIALKVERGEIQPLVQAAPDTPRELAGLVHRAMAARPELRFASATEMRIALVAVADKRPAGAPVATGAMPQVQPSELDVGVTGTLKGAPVEAVIAAAASREASRAMSQVAESHEPKVDTVRAPPVAIAAVAPHPNAYADRSEPPRRRKKSGAPLWIFAVPLVLGAGVVAVVVMSSSGTTPPPPVTPATTTAPTKPTVTTPPTHTNDPVAPPLDPTTHPANTGTGVGPHPSPSGVPAAGDAAAPHPSGIPGYPDGGFAIPSGFPPIPSTFPPFPSGFPPIPSGFPTFTFPGTPPPTPRPTPTTTTTAPAPTLTPLPTHSSGPGY